MAVQSLPTSCGFVLSNTEWTPAFTDAINRLERGRGSWMNYQEKDAFWDLFQNAGGGTGGGSSVSKVVFKIGNAPLTSDSIDATFANGNTFQSDQLKESKIFVRVGASPLAPEEGGYSFDSATGTITTENPLYNVNMYIMLVGQSSVVMPDEPTEFTNEFTNEFL